jgi:RNA polymerase sigma factor (sigma-70 family)
VAHSDVSALYAAHHGWLQGWLRRKLGNACDAADLAHDTFVRVLGRRQASASAPAAAPPSPLPALREPRAYLGAIARGLVADFFRRKDLERAYLEALAALPEAHQPSPETRAIMLEALVAIDAMLDGLKPPVRQAFLLSQLEGMPYERIAAQLGVTRRTVSNYMCKAIEHCLLLAP